MTQVFPVPQACGWAQVPALERPGHPLAGVGSLCQTGRVGVELGLLCVQPWATRRVSEPQIPHLTGGHVTSTSQGWWGTGWSKAFKVLCELESSVPVVGRVLFLSSAT